MGPGTITLVITSAVSGHPLYTSLSCPWQGSAPGRECPAPSWTQDQVRLWCVDRPRGYIIHHHLPYGVSTLVQLELELDNINQSGHPLSVKLVLCVCHCLNMSVCLYNSLCWSVCLYTSYHWSVLGHQYNWQSRLWSTRIGWGQHRGVAVKIWIINKNSITNNKLLKQLQIPRVCRIILWSILFNNW